MAKRKKKSSIGRSLISIVAVIVVIAVSYFTDAWKYVAELGDSVDAPPDSLQVHYIDMGQADSELICVPTASGMKYMLIDAGTSEGYKASTLVNYLKKIGVSTIDYMVITHPHLDHIGAADEVINEFTIKNMIMPECECSTNSWIRVLNAMDAKNLSYIPSKIGETYSIGDASFTILGPVDATKVDPDDTNDYSVVLNLKWGNTSFLFTGDAETTSEAQMLKALPASYFRADVLKAGHHGSTTSSSPSFLDAVHASVVVIPCGEGNSYGHPHKETIDKLEARNTTILRTDLEGTIILLSDKETVTRLTQK